VQCGACAARHTRSIIERANELRFAAIARRMVQMFHACWFSSMRSSSAGGSWNWSSVLINNGNAGEVCSRTKRAGSATT